MGEGQNSGAQNTFDSLMAEMERLVITPETAREEAPAACLISWVVSEGPAQYNYKPDKVHIGPFGHLMMKPSQWMEKEKKKLLSVLLARQRPRHREELQRYLTAMEDFECRARQRYNITFKSMKKEAFACMLLLDGYFLYSRFVANTAPDVRVAKTDITVFRDVVFLLQNQIPFFVLEKIHELVTGADDKQSAFIVGESVSRHVETLVRDRDYVSKEFTLEGRQIPCHLLHLLYMCFRPTALGAAEEVQLDVYNNPPEEDMTIPLPLSRWRAATYYHVAGVRLVKRELDGREACSILDVELIGGTLHVPCLMVDDNTLTMLRNMVALEQQNWGLGSHVTAYCLFMSQMANTEKDVALLVTKGIIRHFLHSDGDVATGLAKLCDDVTLNVYNPKLNYLRQKQDKLEELCRDGWRKSMAWLLHSKCDNYLMVLAVVAAIIVFICTVEQSVLAALSYAGGKN